MSGSQIAKAVDALELFDHRNPVQTVKSIASTLGTPLSSTYRLVNELLTLGLLERLPSGHLITTAKLWTLGVAGSELLKLRDVALPIMELLFSRAREHTLLSVLRGTEVIYLESLSVQNGVHFVALVGEQMPARLNSAGILIAAFSPPDVQDIVLNSELDRHWMVTRPPKELSLQPTSREELQALMNETVKTNFCVLEGRLSNNSTGISVPITQNGVVVAALSHISRREPGAAQRLLPGLHRAAKEISRRLK